MADADDVLQSAIDNAASGVQSATTGDTSVTAADFERQRKLYKELKADSAARLPNFGMPMVQLRPGSCG